MQKESVNMSGTLLVKPKGYAMLFRVITHESVQFEVWKDHDGIDLFWRGRQVEKVYSVSASGERWWGVPIPCAAKALLKRGDAKCVGFMPAPEGELPR